MDCMRAVFAAVICVAMSSGCGDASHPSGPYLGQSPPGSVPEVFAPGLVSTGYHEDGGPAFTPDLKEIYFRIAQRPYPVVFYMKEVAGRWTAPQTAPFSGKYADGAPFISYDGGRLFFSSNRPRSGVGEPRADEDIWYVERVNNTWGEPKNIGAPVNTDQSEWKPSLSRRGTLYFTSKREDDQVGWKIYFSNPRGDDDYSEPLEFDERINEVYKPVCPCIAEDERYMVFASDKNGRGRTDLYVTFQDENGGWSSPVNLGDRINSPSAELFPVLSPDGKYLFYTSWRCDLDSHSELQKSYSEFVETYDSPANGWGGDVYWIDAKILQGLHSE